RERRARHGSAKRSDSIIKSTTHKENPSFARTGDFCFTFPLPKGEEKFASLLEEGLRSDDSDEYQTPSEEVTLK
ncbi:MAG: hypothetical protein ACKO5L_02980, partial [Bacteroidota bacterium]